MAMVVLLTALGCNFHEERAGTAKRETADAENASDFTGVTTLLLNEYCVRCHNPGRAAAGIDLSSFASIDAGRTPSGRSLIDRGELLASPLIEVIASGRMPPRQSVPESSMLLLKCWLAAGASSDSSECTHLLVQTPTPASPTAEPSPISPSPEPPVIPIPITPTPAPSPTPAALSFGQVLEAVLQPHCVGCHEGEFAGEGIDLTTYESVMAARGVLGDENESTAKQALVVPFVPEESLLWLSLVDDRMPYFSEPLTSDQKSLIRQWIMAGARL
jgi:mono/diheme cytochrome c family protein